MNTTRLLIYLNSGTLLLGTIALSNPLFRNAKANSDTAKLKAEEKTGLESGKSDEVARQKRAMEAIHDELTARRTKLAPASESQSDHGVIEYKPRTRSIPSSLQLRSWWRYVDMQYAPLFRSLNVTDGELARLRELLVEKQTAMKDGADLAQQNQLDMHSPKVLEQVTDIATKDINNDIKQLLGPDQFNKYAVYQAETEARAPLLELQETLSGSESQLSDESLQQLVVLYRSLKERAADRAKWSSTYIPPELPTLSQKVLSGAQQEALQDIIAMRKAIVTLQIMAGRKPK